MKNTVGFNRTGQIDAYRSLSPDLWQSLRFPIAEIQDTPGLGLFIFDDFTQSMPPLAPTLTTQIAYGPYKAYAASGCTISRVSAVNSVELIGGALQIAMDTDDDEASIAGPESFLLSGLTTNSGPLVFECCYAQNSIVTNLASTFIGLAETDLFTLAANAPNNSGDAIDNSGAMIGFRIEEDGLGVVDTVRSDRATSFTNIGDTEGGTMAAYTFAKYGMVYDPNNASRCVRFFVNNVECTTALTRAALIALTNLDANALGLLWSVAADSAGTAFKGFMKWWAVRQLYHVGA